MTDALHTQRQQLIEVLRREGVQDARVLAAIERVPRELFVEEAHYERAYENRPLPIMMGQTISQPLVVATMTQALQLSGGERVLEIGTGSGYQTAILAQLAAYVYSIERYAQLAFYAAYHLARMGIENVSIYVGDGSLGWPSAAPYDRILVTAAAPDVPAQLLAQLAPQGILVIPVGSHEKQDLLVIQRTSEGLRTLSLGGCVFVPLIGQDAWHEP
jgi:protein-L-isoaspartate(D-aspartate) O-methyltransferase